MSLEESDLLDEAVEENKPAAGVGNVLPLLQVSGWIFCSYDVLVVLVSFVAVCQHNNYLLFTNTDSEAGVQQHRHHQCQQPAA